MIHSPAAARRIHQVARPAANNGWIWAPPTLPVKANCASFAGKSTKAKQLTWDDEPQPKPRRVVQTPLDPLGVSELRDYITELQGEIARAEAAIARKQDHRGVADSVFRT